MSSLCHHFFFLLIFVFFSHWVSYEFGCNVQGQHDGVWTQQNQANVALSLSPLQAFWERSYDCRPCITEVGMITPCSRTFHTGLQYFEPTLLAVISEFELQRSWNQYQLLSSQNLSFRGAEITFTAKVTNPSLAKVFKRKGWYIHHNRRKSRLSIKGVSKIVLIFYVRFLWSVQERIAESPSLQAKIVGWKLLLVRLRTRSQYADIAKLWRWFYSVYSFYT